MMGCARKSPWLSRMAVSGNVPEDLEVVWSCQRRVGKLEAKGLVSWRMGREKLMDRLEFTPCLGARL